MALLINLRHLEKKALTLRGELSPEELEINSFDELVRAKPPVTYDLEVERLESQILVRGRLRVDLACECARCLKPYTQELELADWVVSLPLEGEEKAEVINDCVDLTPYIREDILLAFPPHPLCETQCGGLTNLLEQHTEKAPGGLKESNPASSAWAELNKLKLED